MEVVVFLGVLVLFIIGFYIKSVLDFKRRLKQFEQRLKTEYGKPRTRVEMPERYAQIGRYYEKHRKRYAVDDITWNDLNMDRLYQRVNYAHSSCGEEYLYYRLRCPDMSAGEERLHADEEAMIAYLQEHEEERVRLQMLFAKIGYTGKYSLYQYLDFLDDLGERSNKKHYLGLALYVVAALVSIFVEPAAGFAFFIILMIYQIATYLKEHGEDEPYLVSFSFILRFIAGVETLIQQPAEGMRAYVGEMADNIKELSPIKRHAFFMAKANTMQGDLMSSVLDYLKMITHINLISFNSMLSAVRKKTKELDLLYTQAGYLEYLLIVGEYRKSLPYCCLPQFHEGGGFSCEKLYHPLIEEPVACSFSAKGGVLVTGSNASGKSTFLKSVALNAILAQSMHTVLAKSCETSYCRVYSSMALRDDLDSGESYYMVEIRALKRILDAAKDREDGPVFCFIDEVLRGTNTVERIAASTQIMKYFTELGVRCYAATHDIELSHLLEAEYDNYHFEEDVSDGDIHFNYELRSGRATTRNAIRLLEIMGYQEQIIARAEQLAEKFVTTGAWQ
ncbi:MAG: hypothetical protein NC409_13075 [Clostridium sp.]|nr:hypothetical protein [Clostridium sp.]